MLISVVAVTVKIVWCLYKVLTGKKPSDHLAHVEPVEQADLEKR